MCAGRHGKQSNGSSVGVKHGKPRETKATAQVTIAAAITLIAAEDSDAWVAG